MPGRRQVATGTDAKSYFMPGVTWRVADYIPFTTDKAKVISTMIKTR
ncbi:MAG: hypothetical protein ABI472_05460 [Ginsengibacter sp.]